MIQFPDRFKKLSEHVGEFPAHILQAEGCKVFFSTLGAGTDIPPHTHETANYSVITQGELILFIDGKEKRFGVGQWCLVPAQVEHSAKTEVDTSLIEFWFDAE